MEKSSPIEHNSHYLETVLEQIQQQSISHSRAWFTFVCSSQAMPDRVYPLEQVYRVSIHDRVVRVCDALLHQVTVTDVTEMQQ